MYGRCVVVVDFTVVVLAVVVVVVVVVDGVDFTAISSFSCKRPKKFGGGGKMIPGTSGPGSTGFV